MGLSGGTFAYLPILIMSFDVEEAMAWSIASGVLAFYMCYIMYFVQVNIKCKVKGKSARVFFRFYQLMAY